MKAGPFVKSKAQPGWGKDRDKVGPTGISALKSNIEDKGRQYDDDKQISKEIEDIDLSQIDENAAQEKVVCQRCEKLVAKAFLDTHMDAHSSEILPWLFLGSRQSADNDRELTVRTNITHILNVANECSGMRPAVREVVEEYLKEKGLELTYQVHAMGDTKDQDILTALPALLSFIHDAHVSNPEHRVLVHCVQGISRSASVVIAYLMQHVGMSLREAYEHTKERRTVILPRREFLDQLGELERSLFKREKDEPPTLRSQDVFAGKTVLNVDAPAVPLVCESSAGESLMEVGKTEGKGKGKGKGKGIPYSCPPPPPSPPVKKETNFKPSKADEPAVKDIRAKMAEFSYSRGRPAEHPTVGAFQKAEGNLAWVRRSSGARELTEEEREAKARQMRERSNLARQAEAARWAHWRSLPPCELQSIDWSLVRQTMAAEGGTGGVVLAELGGSTAVCVKRLGMMAASEFLAERIAASLGVRVAAFRVVSLWDEEYFSLVPALKQAQCMVPEHEALVRHLFRDTQYVAIMEFVPGFGLQGALAQEVLKDPPSRLLEELGRLCAFDLVINNLDRMPLPPWDNDGNLSNVLVAKGGSCVIGIDQQVRAIGHTDGCKLYMTKLRHLVDRLFHWTPEVIANVIYRLNEAFEINCGAKLSQEHMHAIIAGLREGLKDIAIKWESQELLEGIHVALRLTRHTFRNAEGEFGLSQIDVMSNFVLQAACEVWESYRGVPPPSCLA